MYHIEFNSLTRVEGQRKHSGEMPAITHGFNEGVAHMYANPVEREAMEDAALMQKQHTGMILSFRSLLRDNLK